MNPVVGLRLFPAKQQGVQALPWIGLLVDAEEEAFVFQCWQEGFGTAAGRTVLAPPPLWGWRALPVRILSGG